VVRERADYMVERALSKIDATPEQRTQVKSVVRTAIDELFPLREEHKANRKAMIAALSKTEVDREELDRIRNAEMAVFDRGSKAIMTALADSADVLSPEQRAQLAEMAGRWAGGRRHGF
jgi:Spy/CpxP family protein refolding chaperone